PHSLLAGRLASDRRDPPGADGTVGGLGREPPRRLEGASGHRALRVVASVAARALILAPLRDTGARSRAPLPPSPPGPGGRIPVHVPARDAPLLCAASVLPLRLPPRCIPRHGPAAGRHDLAPPQPVGA